MLITGSLRAENMKREVSLPENVDNGKLEKATVGKRWGPYEEVTVLKTEVVEESYDLETFANQEKPLNIPKIEEFASSKKETILEAEDNLPTKNLVFVTVGLVCSFCKVEVLEEKSYESHVEQCKRNYLRLNSNGNVNKPFKCAYENSKSPESHSFAKEKPFKCNMCEYTTAIKMDLNKHTLAKHSDEEKRHKCKDCKYSTHRKGSLVRHMRIHSTKTRFKCKRCRYVALNISDLKGHQLVTHSDEGTMHNCRVCQYSTHTKGHLIRHMHIHTSEKPFKCEMCGYATINGSTLKNHILLRHSDEEKKFKCEACPYSTHIKGHLIRHMRIHTSEKPFKCNSCDYAAANRSTLKNHILLKHSDEEKKYKCKVCQYSTHIKGHLLKHMFVHTNERLFKCNMCDYAANQKCHLNEHTLAKHSDKEKRYKCTDCEYSTHRKGNLARHAPTHTNERTSK